MIFRSFRFWLILVCLIPAASQADTVAYRFEKLVSIPWGTGDTAAGFEQGFDRNQGPVSFTVSGDSIYFLDNVQRQVKVFNHQNGALTVRLRSFPGSYLLDLAADSRGTLYLLDIDNQVFVFAPGNTQPRTTVPISKRLRNIKGLLLNRDTLYVYTSAQFVYPIRQGERYLSSEEQEQEFKEGLPAAGAGYFSTVVEDRHTGIIRCRDAGGVVTEEWPLHFPGLPLLTLIFEGVTNNNRIVTCAESANAAGRPDVFREIVISENGEPIYTIRLPFIYYSYISRDLLVTIDGDIYHMLSDEDGISFIRLRPDAAGNPQRLNYPGNYNRVIHFNEQLRRNAPELREDNR